MADVQIRISAVSRDELTTQKPSEQAAGANVPSEKLAVASIFAHQALTLGKQIVSTSISNIGNFTGDYVKQDRIQNMVGIVSDLATIGTGFAAGGAIGGIVATIGVVTKEILTTVSANKQETHSERRNELLRIRSGNSTTNGSRTGE